MLLQVFIWFNVFLALWYLSFLSFCLFYFKEKESLLEQITQLEAEVNRLSTDNSCLMNDNNLLKQQVDTLMADNQKAVRLSAFSYKFSFRLLCFH